MKLDNRDIQILIALEKNARISNKDLANQISLSQAACWARVRRLETSGFIMSYHAKINLSQLSGFVTILVQVELNNHRNTDFKCFENRMEAEEFVTRCIAVAGELDYFIEVSAASIEIYQAFIDSLLESDLGIHRYTTYLVTKDLRYAKSSTLSTLEP